MGEQRRGRLPAVLRVAAAPWRVGLLVPARCGAYQYELIDPPPPLSPGHEGRVPYII